MLYECATGAVAVHGAVDGDHGAARQQRRPSRPRRDEPAISRAWSALILRPAGQEARRPARLGQRGRRGPARGDRARAVARGGRGAARRRSAADGRPGRARGDRRGRPRRRPSAATRPRSPSPAPPPRPAGAADAAVGRGPLVARDARGRPRRAGDALARRAVPLRALPGLPAGRVAPQGALPAGGRSTPATPTAPGCCWR